jgi:hypothetical protein
MISKSYDYYFCRSFHRLLSSSEEARQQQVETNHQTVRLVEEDRGQNLKQGLKPDYRRYGISRPTLLDNDDENLISTQTSLQRSIQLNGILKLNKGIKAVTIQVRGDKTLVAARRNFVLPDILVSGNFALWMEEFLLAFSEEFVSLTKGPFMSFCNVV